MPPGGEVELAGACAVWFDLPVRRVYELGGRTITGLGEPTALTDPPGWWEAGARRRVTAVLSGRDRLAGFATLTRGPDGQPDLEDLFVDPRCRRQGIVRRLIHDAAYITRRAGRRTITVTGNQHALAFYRAVGFVEIGQAETELGPAPQLRLELTDEHRP